MKKDVEVRGHKFTLKTWNYGEKQRAMRAATTFEEKDGAFIPEVDPYKLNDHMLFMCIVSWDLKDEAGEDLPVSIASIWSIEPPELIEDVLAEVQKMNGVTVEERKK